MGNIHSCTSKGALLLIASANGDLACAQELLAKHPKAASYYNFKDRSSPLLQAAARGHFELVQLILETAVMTEGPERAKKNCIDHANSKRQTALMVACKHGHPDCVEYLVTNGGDALLTDERRHNTCLHFAALYGHSECVHKLLGSRAAYRVQGRQVPVAQIPCMDDGHACVKFIDRHNGWGLSALHIAVFQGSVSTVRALLRHGADVESVTCNAKVENCPIRCAVGSNALHIAALTGNIIMAKLILETQENYPGLELRSRTNAAGLKPHDLAQSARNPVLMHLLDERLPVTLLRQIWMNYSLEQSLPPRHQTLGSMLQKLKLMFNLELIAIQRNVNHLQARYDSYQQGQTLLQTGHGADQPHAQRQTSPAGALDTVDAVGRSPAIPAPLATLPAAGGTSTLIAHSKQRGMEPANVRLLWSRRQEEINQLLSNVTQLHDSLTHLCRRDEPAPGEGAEAAPGGLSRADRAATYEAVLDFILSTLITPRTVSAILHAAKKLVSASVTGTAALTAGAAPLELPPGDSDSQHALALLSTALRAVETCLQAAVFLTSPSALEQHASGAASASAGNRVGLLPGDPVTSGAVGMTVRVTPTVAGSLDGEPQVQSRPATLASDGGSPAALVSDPVEAPGTGVATLSQGSPRTAVGTTAIVLASSPVAGLTFPQVALRGVGDGTPPPPSFATHWSAHLHTLIAQLQWDIGVQRHRRRRAHAAATAARSTAAAATVVSASNTTAANASSTTHLASSQVGGAATTAGSASPAPAPATAAPPPAAGEGPQTGHGAGGSNATAVPSQPRGAAAASIGTGTAGECDADATAAASSLLRVLNSRRGDAVQDIVTSQSNAPHTTRPALTQSNCDSGVSTPVAGGTAVALAGGRVAVGQQLLGELHGQGEGGTSDDPGPPAIQLDEIIPLVSGGLPPSCPQAPTASDATVTTAADGGRETGAREGTTTAPAMTGGKATTVKRNVAKERGKDRGAGAGGGTGGDGGLDGQDDTPAASDSGSDWSDDDRNVCSICMDLPVAVLVAGCQHGLCVQCAFQLCVKGRELPSCPFCRQKIGGFEAKEVAPARPTLPSAAAASLTNTAAGAEV